MCTDQNTMQALGRLNQKDRQRQTAAAVTRFLNQNPLHKPKNTTARNAYNKKFNAYRAQPSVAGRYSPGALQRTGASRQRSTPAPLQRSPSRGPRATAEAARWGMFSRASNRTKTYTKTPTFYKMSYM